MKIVIIVLVLVAVIFVIFVLAGAFRSEPKSKGSKQDAKEFLKHPPGWTKTIKGFVGSKLPKIQLNRPSYTSNVQEKIPPDNKNQIRTATFRVRPGSSASIVYDDDTEHAGDLEHQECPLPNFDNKDDINACSIVALKKGGKLTINCPTAGACLVTVEK